ncbi:hypothetical protein G647_06328 [Cladophialophora carrionii CBS 160.54]|uniref:2,5-diamino-6-ribosylamino-4(3H)-pyrimidinone 5'-phosphate reductase n=1 Tax=Cladophialophora carrionii CBS 160.54 TaxID=1279043 RepID=V9D5V2_9EURO|nr:uncharacterized protein G647_06328 [Cladophialophora carrionii CBS 160.54]ETI22255.1 hypothetical protein G647_06328 [Cladophialophora carrionii CBS 160.54]
MSTDPETPDGADELDHQDDDQLESDGDEDGLNDTSMHDQDEDEGEPDGKRPHGRQYTVVEDEPPDYSVFSNPPNLADIRQRLFNLEDPVQLSTAEWHTYFPFVDNVWRKMRTTESQPEDHTITVDYYACRLRRASTKSYTPRPTPEGKQQRKKRTREEKTCAMTMKVVFHPGDTCTVSRATDGVVKHSHDLDYIDGTKRNTGIMDTARREAAKAYMPASIYWKMWEEPEKMHAAGGKFMKMSDVRNVQYAWRQGNHRTGLKAHKGFTLQRARREPPAPPPPPPPQFQPPAQAGVFGRLEPVKPDARSEPAVRWDTLQYPHHARGFLESYVPDPKLANVRTRPHVTLTWASSLDSRISQVPGVPTAISGPETKAMTHYLRSRHDAILIGVATAIADDPALNCRLANSTGYGGLAWEFQPRPIIIDPHARLRINPEMKVLKTASEGRGKAPWVVVAPGAMLHPMAVSTLKAHGGEYLMINDYIPAQGGLSWEGIFNVLFREGIKSIMVEGGGIVLSELLRMHRSHLIDSVILTIAPTFFGKAGVMVSPEPAFDQGGRPIATRLRNVRWQPMGEADVVMCGRMNFDHARPPNGMLQGIEEYSRAAPALPNGPQGSPPSTSQYPHQPLPQQPPSQQQQPSPSPSQQQEPQPPLPSQHRPPASPQPPAVQIQGQNSTDASAPPAPPMPRPPAPQSAPPPPPASASADPKSPH